MERAKLRPAAGLRAQTGNGAISANLATTRSLDGTFETSNGAIAVEFQREGAAGFDLLARTDTGRASIAVDGAEPVGEQSENAAHHRSPDYAAQALKIQVHGVSDNGDVRIQDAEAGLVLPAPGG